MLPLLFNQLRVFCCLQMFLQIIAILLIVSCSYANVEFQLKSKVPRKSVPQTMYLVYWQAPIRKGV